MPPELFIDIFFAITRVIIAMLERDTAVAATSFPRVGSRRHIIHACHAATATVTATRSPTPRLCRHAQRYYAAF